MKPKVTVGMTGFESVCVCDVCAWCVFVCCCLLSCCCCSSKCDDPTLADNA
jgi:hypothetical protein